MSISIRNLLLATSALVPLGLAPAYANPLGSQVVGGTATIQGQGTSTVTVTQSTDKAIINWNTFNIGTGELTRFIQPSSSSVALNRVTGGLGPSQLYGTLSANGRLFLVNPDGILVGPGGKIDTAGFLATSHDITNADFMAGRYNFSIPGRPDASIVNQGMITAQSGGFAALVAPGVRNTGTISATLGKVGLASGNGFTLDFYGDKLVTLQVGDQIASSVKDVATGQPLRALVSNEGTLKANGGRVELSAVAARQVVDAVINNTGVIEANTIGTSNGMIVLAAATAATKPAGAPTQSVKVSGTLSAAGKNPGEVGGKVIITGKSIKLSNARIDASGDAGGGTVLIGGDVGGGNPSSGVVGVLQAKLEPGPVPTATDVTIDAATVIDASAKSTGNGGKVVAWADQWTSFQGTIFARGGAIWGDGGFAEVSGKQNLQFAGKADLGAPNGQQGTLLLDPQDVTIGSLGTWVITVPALQTALASGNVLVTTGSGTGNGDITVAQSVSWSNANTLVLGAYRNIIINNGITIANTGAGSLDLAAGVFSPPSGNWYGTGTGTIIFNGSGKVDFSHSTGQVNFGYNPIGGYASPTNYSASVLTNFAVPNQFTPFMWVNNVTDLQNINQNLSGKYLLANNIDASATASWNGGAGFIPIGNISTPFTGWLVGVGGTIPIITLGATIDKLTINSSASTIGLFGVAGLGAYVGNVGLTNASITATCSSFCWVGGLAGANLGTVSQTSVGGSINVLGNTGWISVGGLIGENAMQIIKSFSSAMVIATSLHSGVYAGGLVGLNDSGGGAISLSYATGSVAGTSGVGSAAEVGGLVGANGGMGANAGVISTSYATGSVTATNILNFFYLGGLVGASASGIATNSYWDTQTTGQLTSSGGGTGLTTAQLKAGLPNGFDPTVWGISATINNGYPYLLWQTASTPTPPPPTILQPPSSQLSLPVNTSLFGTGQIQGFTQPISWQIAGSTPPVILPSYTPPTPPQSQPTVSGSPLTTGSIGSLPTTSSFAPMLVEIKNAMGSQTHLIDEALFNRVVSAIGLNTKYSSDGGYIYPPNYSQYQHECVALVLALRPDLRSPNSSSSATDFWTPGSQVDLNGKPNPALQPGMAIATFTSGGSKGTYPADGIMPDGTIAHTAIFLGYGYDAKGNLGMYILDQYTAHPGIVARPAEIRFDVFNTTTAAEYYVVVPKSGP